MNNELNRTLLKESKEKDRIISDIMMIFVEADIASKEELIDIDKRKLTKMLNKIAERVDYYAFVDQHHIFIN